MCDHIIKCTLRRNITIPACTAVSTAVSTAVLIVTCTHPSTPKIPTVVEMLVLLVVGLGNSKSVLVVM